MGEEGGGGGLALLLVASLAAYGSKGTYREGGDFELLHRYSLESSVSA